MKGLAYKETTCRFGGSRGRPPALECFSLECPPGEITCLLGPNGAGKSTALAAAAGLIPIREGSITYGDEPVSQKTPPREMGFLPQTSAFPGVLTVGEILDFSFDVKRVPRADRDRDRELFGLADKTAQAAGTLSSGWIRRLGLAVALLRPSPLLLLDEPFVGLDLAILDAVVAELIDRARAGATVVLSSHDFEIVDQLRPRLAVLVEGRLVQATSRGRLSNEGSRSLYRRALGRPNEEERLEHAAG
jgi:ABC-type multidrug transport system ATPase subunit